MILTTNLTSNLKYLTQKTKITSVDLAEIVGVSAELIGKLKNGSLRNPSLKVISGISKHFNVSLQDLIFSDLQSIGSTVKAKPITRLPVVNWDTIKDWHSGGADKSIVVDNVSSNSVFALRLDREYGGVFEKNIFLLVDTEKNPKNQDYVLVLNKENGLFHIKKLIIEDAYYLQSVLLDTNNVVKYDENECSIYGVVIGYQKTKFF